MKMKIKNGKLSPYTKNSIISYGIVIIAFVVVTVLNSMGAVSSSLQGQLVPICAYIIMAVSLNLVVGISGELSLGHAGFMSAGAFMGIVVSGMLESSGLPGWRKTCGCSYLRCYPGRDPGLPHHYPCWNSNT